jgi:hypothetical protein
VTTRPPSHEEVDEAIFVYEYPVDVELKGKRFGALRDKWLTLWGGGTLVFDPEGGLRHHAAKPVTRERVDAVLRFLSEDAARAGLTVVGPTDDDEVRRVAARRPFLAETGPSVVTLRANPSARCALRGEGRNR